MLRSLQTQSRGLACTVWQPCHLLVEEPESSIVPKKVADFCEISRLLADLEEQAGLLLLKCRLLRYVNLRIRSNYFPILT